MELFRITQDIYKEDLSGRGAYLWGGRWNSIEHYVIYSAQSRSLAMLETIVHLNTHKPIPNYSVCVIYVPDNASVEVFNIENHYKNWHFEPDFTQNIGDEWLESRQTLLFRVPSIIVKNEYNYLINPLHPEFSKVKIIEFEPFEFDSRLIK